MMKYIRIIFIFSLPFFFAQGAKLLNGLTVNLAGVVGPDQKGREQVIIESVFECMGVKATFNEVPYGRHLMEFQDKKHYDFVTTIPYNEKLSGFKTLSHIAYYNGVITRASLKKEIKSLKDLAGLSVIAFQDALKLLPGLNKVVNKFKVYKETTKQELQGKLIIAGRMDAAISDSMIFYHYTRKLRSDKDEGFKDRVKFKFHNIFKPSRFHLYFSDQKLQKSFDTCFSKLRVKGGIQKINHLYMLDAVYDLL